MFDRSAAQLDNFEATGTIRPNVKDSASRPVVEKGPVCSGLLL
jgi:hypothetical protein